MATVQRKAAPRHARPAQRHFARKGAVAAHDGSSDEDEEQAQAVEAEQEPEDEEIGTFGGEKHVARVQEKASRTVKVALGNVEVKDGRVFVNGLAESGKTVVEQEQEAEESSESEDEEEEESSEGESESEEEVQKPQIRPVFVKKDARGTIKERDEAAFDTEEATKKREAAAAERKRQSRNMVGETIKKGLEEKEVQEPGKEIDDTDGLEAEAEFEAWRMRELMRLKRDKEAERQREEERLEIERRRALPEEQRLKEDLERAQKLRDEKPSGSGAFMQKYWHKGGFYQDMDEVKRRDLMGPLDSHVDVSLLPKVMQVKDFGKRSRTKYTHLKDQDTTMDPPPKAGGAAGQSLPANGQGCFLCGGPHLKRDCPQNTGPPGDGPPRTGTNASSLSATRKWGEAEREGERSDWRDGPTSASYDHDRKYARYHEDRNGTARGPDRRRSRSPRRRSHSRSRDERSHRRSTSPGSSRRDRSPKRRRLD